MPFPLLTTKLYLPTARQNLLQRPRLTARLSAGLQRPLTLISAPAGFGKTTVLSDWRATPEGQAYPLAWVSLDAGDNDPARFWAYVTAALRTLPDLAGLPAELDPGAAPDLLLAPLINGLAAGSAPVLLVLDDYHTIESPAIHTALSFLVEHMPAALRLLILTRADPPWPLARLRANGRLAELRAADLRFTPQEAAAFFRHAGLSPADTAALAERTEGWAAALQMAALSLDGHPDPHGFVAAFSGENRYITDYLTEEVLARQPEPLRRFLLQCSVLERLSAPLCSAVTGRPDSLALLEQTDRSNLFLVPLDPVRQWFRFHHLFGSLLQTYLRQTEPDLMPVLHRRAAAWHAENDLPLEAARHSLAAGDHDRTLQLIEAHAGGWWAMASPAFTALLAQLPPEVTRRSPQLCTYRAWMSCMLGQMESALGLIDTAEKDPALAADIRSFLALMRTYIADLSGQNYKLTETVLQAPSYIPEQGGADLRSAAELVLAYLLYRNGQLDQAAALWLRAADREVARGTTHAIPVAIPLVARIRLIEGQAAEAVSLCRRYIAIVRERGEASFFVWGNLLAVLAEALSLEGSLEEAEAAAREAIQVNQAFAIAHAAVLPLHALARVRLARGAAGEALALLDDEEQGTRSGLQTPDTLADRTALRVQAWLAAGDLEAAARWARESRLAVHDPLSFRHELAHLAFARVLLATGRATEAETLLSRLERAAEAGGRWGHVAEIKRLRQQAQVPSTEVLTEREREILQLIADGRSNQEIARSLVVAVGTVKTHVHNLLEKLGAQSRTEAVARGRERHLLK